MRVGCHCLAVGQGLNPIGEHHLSHCSKGSKFLGLKSTQIQVVVNGLQDQSPWRGLWGKDGHHVSWAGGDWDGKRKFRAVRSFVKHKIAMQVQFCIVVRSNVGGFANVGEKEQHSMTGPEVRGPINGPRIETCVRDAALGKLYRTHLLPQTSSRPVPRQTFNAR